MRHYTSTTASITARALTISATGVNKTYDGGTTASVTLSDNRVSGDALTTAYTAAAFGDKNVGVGKAVSATGISLSGADAGNYTFNTTANTTASITVASLLVTANDATQVAGQGLPAFSASYSGFAPGDDAGSLGGALAFATTEPAGNSHVGTFTITPSGLTSGNYQITYQPGTLTVVPGAAAQLSIAGPAGAVTGQSFGITVTALDAYGNVVSGYAGRVHFNSGDSHASLPADYTFLPQDAGAHTFNVTLGTAGAQSLGASDGAAGGSLNVSVLPPKSSASAFVVNDGGAQRSMVKQLTVTFTNPVTASAGAFTLTGQLLGGGTTNVPLIVTPQPDGKTFVITFGGNLPGGSVADGRYTLSVSSSLIHDAYGQTLSADQTYTFFRLFGDCDGNGTVNNADYAIFLTSYNKTSSSSNYLWYLDYDGNGAVNNFDYGQFRNRSSLSV